MKNVFLLGNLSSIFVRDFCAEVLGEKGIKTTILSLYYSDRYLDDYQKSNVTITNWLDSSLQKITKKIILRHLFKYALSLIKINIQVAKKEGVDVFFVHYVEPVSLLCFYIPWKKAKKRILVFWGSDILRISNGNLKLLPLFLKQSTDIVFMIPEQYEYFQEKVGHKYDGKVHILDFGNSVLSRIDKTSSLYSRKQCKEKFGFPEDKIIVHVGYNAAKAQQHIEIMKSVASHIHLLMGKELKRKLKFVFHISYGHEDDFETYMNDLKIIMDKNSLDYVFIDTYLQDDDLAMFRRTCDVFLYGNKTDALSASPLEYIYAGAMFVCPKWLQSNYKLFNDGNIPYYVYDNFDELGSVFNKCLVEYGEKVANDGEFENIDSNGRQVIKNAKSWESLAPKWRSLYE